MAKHIEEWAVWEKESLSDHNYISFRLLSKELSAQTATESGKNQKMWNVARMNKEKLATVIEEMKLVQNIRTTAQPPNQSANQVANELSADLGWICDAIMPRKAH